MERGRRRGRDERSGGCGGREAIAYVLMHPWHQRWLNEHVNDKWVKDAQKDGYRSRAAYKLLQVTRHTKPPPSHKKPKHIGADLAADHCRHIMSTKRGREGE